MSEERRYLNADEVRQVNEYAEQYFENPPENADPVLDDLDRSILKSESFPTLDTANTLAVTRNKEAERRAENRIPPKVAEAIRNDDVLADLDDAICGSWEKNYRFSRDENGNLPEGVVAPDDVYGKGAEARRKQAEAREATRQAELEDTANIFNGRGRSPRQRFER